MKYTLETLREINNRFCGSHRLSEYDVNLANKYVELIESTRSDKEPRIGDMIQYTNDYGDYYMAAHIEKVTDSEVHICEQPYVPFIYANDKNDGIWSSTSGGAWCDLPIAKLTYVGKKEKKFCDWGNCGACADGAVEFKAEVSVWEYVSSGNKFISTIYGKPYTTKDFRKMYVYYNPNRENTHYVFFGDSHAWKNDLDFQAWLRTFRAEIFCWTDNCAVVWYWKEEKHSVSPKEFEALDLPEDTLMNNGNVMRCKRKYDETTHTVHTYWVWYWDEPEKDWRQAAMDQNKIRAELYHLAWGTPVNQYATKEIMSGQIKPIDLSCMKRLGKNKENN